MTLGSKEGVVTIQDRGKIKIQTLSTVSIEFILLMHHHQIKKLS